MHSISPTETFQGSTQPSPGAYTKALSPPPCLLLAEELLPPVLGSVSVETCPMINDVSAELQRLLL